MSGNDIASLAGTHTSTENLLAMSNSSNQIFSSSSSCESIMSSSDSSCSSSSCLGMMEAVGMESSPPKQPLKRSLPCHRRSQSVGVCELKTMISDFEITTHPPTPLSPSSSSRKMNYSSNNSAVTSTTLDDMNISSTTSTRVKSGSLIHFAQPKSSSQNPITTRTTMLNLSPNSPEDGLSSSPNSSGSSASPNTSFNSSSSPPSGSSERKKTPRKVSFKESFLNALSKPKKFIEKLSPRGNHEKQHDSEVSNDLKKVPSEEVIADTGEDMRRSLDPGLLQREAIKRDLKEKHKPGKSTIGKFTTSNMDSDLHRNDMSPPLIRLVVDKYPITTHVKKFLNPQLILYIMNFISLPFGRYLSKTTKTSFNKDNYFKLFFGKFKLGFFQRGNISTHDYFLIFKHIYISDNFNIDFTEIGPLFKGVPLAKIESLSFIQFRTDSNYSCLSTLKGKLPFLLQHMKSLKKLYINTEYITNDDMNSLLLDGEASSSGKTGANDKSTQLHHKEHHGLFHRKTKQITCNLNQNRVHNIMNNIEELVIGSLKEMSTVNIQNLPNLKYFVWRTRVDGTLLFNSQPELFTCTTLELSKVMLKPNQLKLLFSGLPTLINLKIEYLSSRLSHNSVCQLQENKNLKRLTLRYCKNTDYNIGDVICISVSNHPNLCVLDISGMETRDEAIQYLFVTNAGKNVVTNFKCKGRLIQTDNNNPDSFSMIQGPGLKDIQLNTKLTFLDLSNHPITLEGLSLICQSTSIRQLILRNCSMDNAKIYESVTTLFLSKKPNASLLLEEFKFLKFEL
ncbi:predicted protein [Naegleria gruberi]|uniref:Predicted protein n=1 Tax=Naegleria gruberi TaxID=5762 RepID=D2V654_NAEGR|nr:uncharacterized protein NAEGRDRAFT_64315 [Naegleria gruberi]EFC47906.1 predicted protein [Naegleria gruberi]|eukprot:XP_002680650.1 predicted protein [Naegleria gruberi strain NEG-M]